jgi:hypothetical protein
MPNATELLEAYAAAGGPPTPDLTWFVALTRYKEAAASALLNKRGRKAGGQLDSSISRMVPALSVLLDEAMELVRT